MIGVSPVYDIHSWCYGLYDVPHDKRSAAAAGTRAILVTVVLFGCEQCLNNAYAYWETLLELVGIPSFSGSTLSMDRLLHFSQDRKRKGWVYRPVSSE